MNLKFVRKNRSVFILLLSLILFFIGLKVYTYYSIKRSLDNIDYIDMSYYIDIYFYTHNEYPKDANSFNNFVKKYDRKLYENLKNLTYYPFFSNKDDNLSFERFYMYGFDNKNDSLKINNYDIEIVSLLESFTIKGDLNFIPKSLPRNNIFTNSMYEVKEDSMIKIEKFAIYDGYKKILNCHEIRPKDYFSGENQYVLFRIKNGIIDKYNSSFSKKSEEIFENELKKSKFYKNDNKIYIMLVGGKNIEDIICF